MRFFLLALYLLFVFYSLSAERSVGLGVIASSRLHGDSFAVDMTGFVFQTDHYSNTFGLSYSTNWVFGEKYSTTLAENSVIPKYREKYGHHDLTLFYGLPIVKNAPIQAHVLLGVGFFVEKLIAFETYQEGRFVYDDSYDIITTTTSHVAGGLSLRNSWIGAIGLYNAASESVSVGILYYW